MAAPFAGGDAESGCAPLSSLHPSSLSPPVSPPPSPRMKQRAAIHSRDEGVLKNFMVKPLIKKWGTRYWEAKDHHDPPWMRLAQKHNMEQKKQEHVIGIAYHAFVNLFASFIVAGSNLITVDSVLGCMFATAYTLLYYYHGQYLAVNMNWNIVSLAVIFPISQGIKMAFKRREQALFELANLLSHLAEVGTAFHRWTVQSTVHKDKRWCRIVDNYSVNGDKGKQAKEDVRLLFEQYLTGLVTYFDVPRWGRARHAVCAGDCGYVEQAELIQVAYQQRIQIDNLHNKIIALVQDWKAKNLSGGECHRLDQYCSKIKISFEKLVCLKEYRTPQAFRSFARVYILMVGALYGPYYVTLAKGDSDNEDNVGIAVAFACSIQIAMSGLFNVMLGLEDPFARRGGTGQLDSVRVPEMCEAFRQQMLQVEYEADYGWRPVRDMAMQDKSALPKYVPMSKEGPNPWDDQELAS